MKKMWVVLIMVLMLASCAHVAEENAAICKGIDGKVVARDFMEATDELVLFTQTDDMYGFPTDAQFNDALLTAKYDVGVYNHSDAINNTDGGFKIPFDSVTTVLAENGECTGGILQLIGAIEAYQNKKVNCPWRWPVGVATSENMCRIIVRTQTGVKFFHPQKLYEDTPGQGEVIGIYF